MTFSILKAAHGCKTASSSLAALSSEQKNSLLAQLAHQVRHQKQKIIAANQRDMQRGETTGLNTAMLDRLMLDSNRIEAIANAVEAIAEQPDPVGNLGEMQQMPSGIKVGRMRIPLGVVAMIYESRPNVTIDAAALCLKAGNAVILRGGKEALYSNLALAQCIGDALLQQHLPQEAVTLVPDPDRTIMDQMLTLTESIDLIIPRGGEGLIRYVSENSKVPVIQHYKGVCHLYVHQQADVLKAIKLLENGKTQRTGVCNALETLLVDKAIAEQFLPLANQLFLQHEVKVHACQSSIGYFPHAQQATECDWHAEYLALQIAVKVVDDLQGAIEHIRQYGSGHTEVIATENKAVGEQFLRSTDAAVVMVNASSRFSDGGELGLGAEIGISTSKLHAYGPMGAESLTAQKFIVLGDGHVRS